MKNTMMLRRIAQASILTLVTAAVVAMILVSIASSGNAQVLTGADILVAEDFATLAGRRVGLVMNQTARLSVYPGTTLDAFLRTTRCRLVSLFAPEHGLDGRALAGAVVNDTVEPQSGLPVYSLYGPTKKPSPEMLRGIDVLVYDIQDIGVRSYTYISTLVKVMEGCADAGLPLVVLDRPNPIGGDVVDGPVLDTAYRSFVGILPIPYIHGMTVGELALMANREGWLEGERHCDITIVRMRGWRRSMSWEETGLRWTATSPNVQSPESAFCNGVTGAIGDLRIVNIGIGTTRAFQIVAREWIDASRFADHLNSQRLSGFHFEPFTMESPQRGGAGGRMYGVHIRRTAERTSPFTAQIALLTTMRDLFPDRVRLDSIPAARWAFFDKVCGGPGVRQRLLQGADWRDIVTTWEPDLHRFISRRESYLLYE